MSYEIVNYDSKYCNDISNIITRNLLEINVKDYGLEKMQEDVTRFTPEMIERYSKESKIYVALDKDKPVGTLRVGKFWGGGENDYVFLTIFVLPEYHGKGIGRLLMENAEKYVTELGAKTIKIPSGITAHRFYNKLGYNYMNGLEPDAEGIIFMNKDIG